MKLIDNNLDLPAVDRDFIAAQYVEEKVEGAVNPLNALCRYQFLEILVRVAKTKFEIKGQAFSHSACLEKLLSECILKNDKSEPWSKYLLYGYKNIIKSILISQNKDDYPF